MYAITTSTIASLKTCIQKQKSRSFLGCGLIDKSDFWCLLHHDPDAQIAAAAKPAMRQNENKFVH
jgi:hypothetical protein